MSAPGAIAFTDIVGFTEFTATEGDHRALEVLDEQRRIVDELLPPDGRVVKELGDGLLIWIDAAQSALVFCRNVQGAVRAASAVGRGPLWIRIGLHWGGTGPSRERPDRTRRQHRGAHRRSGRSR